MPFKPREMERQSLAKRLGDRIEQRRRELGLSKQQLADLSGLTRASLHQYTRHAAIPGSFELWKVAQALRLSPSDLLEGLAPAEAPEENQPLLRLSPTARSGPLAKSLSHPDGETIAGIAALVLELRRACGLRPWAKMPRLDIPPAERHRFGTIRFAADLARQQTGHSPGAFAPAKILEALGCDTVFVENSTRVGDGLAILWGKMPLVLLPRPVEGSQTPERVLHAALREAGHLLLHRRSFLPLPHLGSGHPAKPASSLARDAERFARHFLVPETELLHLWWKERLCLGGADHLGTLEALKAIFMVPARQIFLRLVESNLVSRELCLQALAKLRGKRGQLKTKGDPYAPEPAATPEPFPLPARMLDTGCRTRRLARLAARSSLAGSPDSLAARLKAFGLLTKGEIVEIFPPGRRG